MKEQTKRELKTLKDVFKAEAGLVAGVLFAGVAAHHLGMSYDHITPYINHVFEGMASIGAGLYFGMSCKNKTGLFRPAAS